jgi:hypothetical protein|tara:strand:+ start:3937 stop:4143 length:207 start_codon:yes stop_codon:yes gene_type:complete
MMMAPNILIAAWTINADCANVFVMDIIATKLEAIEIVMRMPIRVYSADCIMMIMMGIATSGGDAQTDH